MKATLFFVFYFLTASVLAALIAYPLFLAFGTNEYRFEKWVTRAALLFLILGLIPCFKFFKLSLNAIGHNNTYGNFFKKTSFGFISGLLILGVVVFTLIVLDIRVLSEDAQFTWKLVSKALLAGIVVALIEETLFRGLFFKLSQQWHNGFTAVVVSSFFYAILHFIKPIEHIDQNLLYIGTGFEVIVNAFKAVAFMPLDDFLALFVVGAFLALVRLQTRTLAYCIGLHASWVFLIKITKELTDHNPESSWTYLTGQYDGIIGILSFIWISVIIFAYLIYVIKPKYQPHS
jgi:membrane protease YdiL (CAAX protease family)|tara:strand:+ start:4055 stop:4921 length:867 start_codon:yes stop_codon:yes gene_type:complete